MGCLISATDPLYTIHMIDWTKVERVGINILLTTSSSKPKGSRCETSPEETYA